MLDGRLKMQESSLDTADDFDISDGKVIKSWTLGTKNIPVHGKVIKLSQKSLTIEKADHRRMMLRRDSIISVEATEAN